jgi:hypothetical protein
MNTKNFYKRIAIIALPTLMLASCSDSDTPNGGNGSDANTGATTTAVGKYVIATSVQGSNAVSYVLITADSLDEGVANVDNGLLNDGATQWIFHDKNYLYALTYNQGNAGTTRSYTLNAEGNPVARDFEYKVSRFTSYGIYGDYIMSMAASDGPSALADANGYLPKTLAVTYLDVNNETSTSNDTSTGAYSLENYVGNGEYVMLAGIEQNGSRIFSGVVPMGLSQYGAAYNGGQYIREGYEHLVKTADGGTNSSAYKKGELQWSQYPDECWVAIYDNKDMKNPTLVKTDKISAPCGRYKSQYYQSVWAADNGDVYVFSSSHSKTFTDPLQQTKLPAGVARIPAGSNSFDDYYCNLEAQSNGNSFMRCWYISDTYFLMLMHDVPMSQVNLSQTVATKLAIFDASTKKLTYVTGLPSDISSVGSNILAKNGVVYIPINETDQYPAFYRIDPSTAIAKKGLTVNATSITGIGYMEAK